MMKSKLLEPGNHQDFLLLSFRLYKKKMLDFSTPGAGVGELFWRCGMELLAVTSANMSINLKTLDQFNI